MSAHQIILIAYLLGLAFGMGGAMTIDAMFLIASRRGKVSPELVEVVHAAAGLVAAAMLLLTLSGTAFFFVGVESSPKFWAKMVIVGIACLNGLAAHRLVFPLIEAATASGTGQLRLRFWPARLASASAAISGVSWSGALVLGAWRGCPFGLVPLLAGYAVILAAAVLVSAFVVAPRVFVLTPVRRGHRTNPAKAAAQAFALAVANGALALAKRLSDDGGRPEPGGFAPAAMPAYAAEPGPRAVDGGGERPRRDGAPPRRRPVHGLFDAADQELWTGPRDWPGYRVDIEPEASWG